MTPTRFLLIDLILVGCASISLYVAIRAGVRLRDDSSPRGPLIAVLALSALALLGFAAYGVANTGVDAYPDRHPLVLLAAFAVVILISVALADSLFVRVPGRLGGWLGALFTIALLAGLVVAAALALTALTVDDVEATPPARPETFGTIEAEFPLPAGPLDVAMDGPASGYVSLDPDVIARFELPGDAEQAVTLTTVASGLDHPRGLALHDGTLYATLVGPTPCPDPAVPSCLPDASRVELELATIAQSSGSVVAFPVLDDGALGEPETLLTDLPVGAFDHGINGLEIGPDGRLYVTVGGYSDLALYPEAAAEIDHPYSEYLGTVLSMEPDGTDLRVFARGLRNVYDITFSPDGTMYGVDNDGEALNAVRREELIRIVDGADYGWPDDGTYSPFTQRTHFPAWVLDERGSSGVLWSNDFYGKVGLATGSMGSVHFVEFGTREGAAAPLVGADSSVSRMVIVNGYATTLDQLPDGRLLVGVFSPWAPDSNAFLIVSDQSGSG